MIEVIIRNFLIEKLDVPVFLELPASYPDYYLTIEKTGSGVTNRIKRSTFAIQSNAPTMYEAAELNERAKAAMDDAVELDEV